MSPKDWSSSVLFFSVRVMFRESQSRVLGPQPSTHNRGIFLGLYFGQSAYVEYGFSYVVPVTYLIFFLCW